MLCSDSPAHYTKPRLPVLGLLCEWVTADSERLELIAASNTLQEQR